MPHKDAAARKRYREGYWKTYYADPVRRAKHIKAVRVNAKVTRDKVRQWLADYKTSRGCRSCGYNAHHAALDFAHRDRSQKMANIGTVCANDGWSMEKIQAEIDKCDILCANCHRVETFDENRGLVGESGRPRYPVTVENAGSNPVEPAKV